VGRDLALAFGFRKKKQPQKRILQQTIVRPLIAFTADWRRLTQTAKKEFQRREKEFKQ